MSTAVPSSATAISLETLTGPALLAQVRSLGDLRATVFRAWPYLYAATPEDEAAYLATYAASGRAGLVLARAGQTVIGAATCLPMADETEAVQAPFRTHGLDPARFFYFGESVLLPPWRGQGLGVAFFHAREAHALAVSDADFACFCAVQRPDDHPARPAGATTLDAFWRRRGYTPRPDLVCRFTWRDLGDAAPTEKPLMFWLKSLRGRPLP